MTVLSVDPRLIANIGRDPVRVFLGDSEDERVRQALPALVARGLVAPVLVDATDRDSLPEGVDVVSTGDASLRDACVDELVRAAAGDRTADDAAAMLRDPLMFGAVYTRLGGTEAGMAGSLSTSASVIRAGIVGLGLAHPGGLASGCFLMQGDDDLLTFADCSVVPDPSAEQLAEIAVLAGDTHRLVTGTDARVALLSFSTNGSATHPKVQKVREALALARAQRPDLEVDGEMQFDVAVVPYVAAQKFPGSPVGGRANVFIFPDLDAGNIGYKMAERFGGRRAIGSVVMGLQRPWVDLSRGCSVDDIVDTAIVAACLARAESRAPSSDS